MEKEVKVAVVGLSHYMDDYDEFCENLAKGTRVFLTHDLGNYYDEYAIEVKMMDGRKVGYISRQESKQVCAGIHETTTIGRVTDAKHKCFHISVKVDAEAYDNAQFSTESRMIKSQLDDGILGLRNVLPTLHDDTMMIQAWTMIKTGSDDKDEELLWEGVHIFEQYFGCSLCVEDTVRARWLVDNGYDKNQILFKRLNDLTDREQMHKVCLKQLNDLMDIDGKVMEEFRRRFHYEKVGRSAVEHWLDTILDGQLKGCYNELTPDMASIILYRSLSRNDMYILFSHIVAISNHIENVETQVNAETKDRDAKIKSNLIRQLTRLTPYIINMDAKTYEEKLEAMFDLCIQDNLTQGRKELWRLLTKRFSRDNKENGLDRIVTMNLVGQIKKNGYFNETDDELARIVYMKKRTDSDGNNIGRAFEAKRYTKEVESLVRYYFQ